MNHSSNVTTEVDPITVTVTEQRAPARVRPERPVRRLRRGTSPRLPATQEGASSEETARRRDAAMSVQGDLPQPYMSLSQDWTTSATEHAGSARHDEYDELLASVLSDDDSQSGSFQDPDAADTADHARDLVDSRDKAPAAAVSEDETDETDETDEAGESPDAQAQTQPSPGLKTDQVDAGDDASIEESTPEAGTGGSHPAQKTDTSPRDQLNPLGCPQLSREADDASGEASALAQESLPASRTRARRGRTTSAAAATLQEQPTASPLAPVEREATEPAPLPPAPLYVWQGSTLMSAHMSAQPASAPIPDSPPARNVDAPAATTTPAAVETPAPSRVTVVAGAPAVAGPSVHLQEASDVVSAAPSTATIAEPEVKTASEPVPPADSKANETTPSASGREVTAPQASVPGAGLDTATFVRQVRDAELRDAAPVLSPVHAVPDGGWRSAVMKLTLGRVQPPPSARQAERDHEIYRVRTSLNGNRHIVVLAYGTGVGKTLTTGSIGLQFAEHRDDRVAVIDADQTAGNLADRFATPAGRFLQDLLEEHQHSAVDSIVELRRYARSAKRLDIYSADHTRSYSAQQHRDALALLSKFHDIVITDLGSSGLRDMPEVLQTATDVVVVTGTSMDAVDRSRKVLDRLEELGHARLAREAVVAMVTRTTKDGTLAKAARNGGVHVETLISHFQKRCRATVLIPYSARLADGVHVDYETLDSDVNEAYLRIAGFLANGFRPALDRQAAPEGAGASGPAQLPAIHAGTAPAATAKAKLGRGRRKEVETSAPSAFAALPHYQGS